MNRSNFAIGVDIGGTHITAALVDLQQKTIIPSSIRRATVNAGDTADEIIDAWSNCITDARQHHTVECICIAMPGPFDYEAGISLMRGQDKYESLYGLNIKEHLAKSLGISKQTIFMDNDAACFLQGEVFNGAAGSYEKDTVIGITLGTGLGSAVYKDGKSRNADMWCWPFKEEIAEDYLSTRWFVHRWNQLTGETIGGVKELTLKQDNKEHIIQLFNEFTDHLSSFLSDFMAKESPAVAVIGGNIARSFDWFGPTLLTNINTRHPGVKIVQAKLGEEAQLLGAVSSWLQRQKTRLSLT
jgi:glucokinase